MTAAGLGASAASDFFSNGQPCRARSLQQASEALREHMLPHLGLSTLMALSRACSDWHQLIFTTPLDQLARHQNRDLLPHGMTSHQPLGEVLQERGSLVARLRHDHKPRQHASHDTVPYQHPESHVQGMCILSWSPQPDISQPSQHILISRPWTDPYYQGYERITSVLDLHTGQLVDFHAGRSCVASTEAATAAADPSQDSALGRRERNASNMAQLNAGTDQHKLDEGQQEAQEHMPAQCINIRHARSAAWAADAQHATITLSSPQTSPHSADASGRTGTLILADVLLRTRAIMLTQPHESFPQGAISPAGDMILSQTSTPLNPDVRLNIYSLPSLQHHFLLAAPASAGIFNQALIKYQQFAWSPDGSKIAVWWLQKWPTVPETDISSSPSATSLSDYVTIHRTDDGKCLTSTIMVRDSHPRDMPSTQDIDQSESDESDDESGEESEDGDHDSPEIQWDPSGSYILWTHKDTITCICPAGGQVWRSSGRERCPDISYKILSTTVGSAASRQYLSVADHLDENVDLLTMLDALTGRTTTQWSIRNWDRGHDLVGSERCLFASKLRLCAHSSCSCRCSRKHIHQALAMGMTLGNSHKVACPPFDRLANQRFLISSSIPGTRLPWLLRLSQAQKAPHALPIMAMKSMQCTFRHVERLCLVSNTTGLGLLLVSPLVAKPCFSIGICLMCRQAQGPLLPPRFGHSMCDLRNVLAWSCLLEIQCTWPGIPSRGHARMPAMTIRSGCAWSMQDWIALCNHGTYLSCLHTSVRALPSLLEMRIQKTSRQGLCLDQPWHGLTMDADLPCSWASIVQCCISEALSSNSLLFEHDGWTGITLLFLMRRQSIANRLLVPETWH